MTYQPTPSTLRKYGITEAMYRVLLLQQGGVCAICRKPSKRLCLDHEHVKGWKKMPPERRRKYLRGILCWVCNHYYVGRGISLEKARNVVDYLQEYEQRKGKS